MGLAQTPAYSRNIAHPAPLRHSRFENRIAISSLLRVAHSCHLALPLHCMASQLLQQIAEPVLRPIRRQRAAASNSSGRTAYNEDDTSNATATVTAQPEVAAEGPPEDAAVTKSPLFRLPRELRDVIWSFCLIAQDPIRWPSDECNADLTPALLATCKKVKAETLPILYGRNVLNFAHPSDANMFLWVHSGSFDDEVRPLNGQLATRLLLNCRDVDVPVWNTYLGSTSSSRSLLHDYPRLQVLHIVYQTKFWDLIGGDVIDRYRRWQGDRALKSLCQALDEHANVGADIKVLVVQSVPRQDIASLKAAYPRDLLLVRNANGAAGREVRTRWTQLYRADVALELRPLDELSASP